MTPASKDAPAPAWAALRQHHAEVANLEMRGLFARDSGRARRFRLEACGLFLDYSRHRILEESLERLRALASESGVSRAVDGLFTGAPVNNTENRPALHAALRYLGDGPFPSAEFDVMPEVRAARAKMRDFCLRLKTGRLRGVTERPLKTLVSLGIGGSHLGPALACAALEPYADAGIDVHFVSSLDGASLDRVLRRCVPEETLFIVTSKSFSTEETLSNAQSARAWLKQRLGDDPAIERKHFVAITACEERAKAFGIDAANCFPLWEWVGGRYSLWSAVGLPVAAFAGMDAFEALLAGAAEMDGHFRRTPAQANMPILLALLEVWYRNLFGAATRAVIPYDHALGLLPAYLQQLEMESNGKSVSRDGRHLRVATAPVVWGATGSDAQHAFFQLLHQGNALIPSEFIVPLESQRPLPGHQASLLANALAQATALMRGRSLDETRQSLKAAGMSEAEIDVRAPHRVMPGNQPTSLLLYEQLDPRTLGALIALYEHKVFVESVIWDVNPFDQWGVELGKTLARAIRPAVEAAHRAGRRSKGTLIDRASRLLDACSPDGY